MSCYSVLAALRDILKMIYRRKLPPEPRLNVSVILLFRPASQTAVYPTYDQDVLARGHQDGGIEDDGEEEGC